MQQGGLVADFGFYDLPPEPLFQRFARLDLRPVVLTLRPVRIEVEEHGVGHAVAPAEDHRDVVVRQCVQQRQGKGGLLVFEHHEADVLDRDALLLAGRLLRVDDHLIVLFRLRQKGVEKKSARFSMTVGV